MILQKIVITGGPCGGKTTALSWIANRLPEKGYRVLFVPETATELIGGGLTPWGCGTNLDYQLCQMELQLTKERLFERGGRTIPADKILLVCDRGAMDNKAYMTDEEFDRLCEQMGTDEAALKNRYDAVFHLVTAAKGAPEAYTTANNAARYETPEVACAVDDRIIAAWTGHPHFRIIDNSTAFEEKLERLLREILSFLGESEVLKARRQFLIRRPDRDWLAEQPGVHTAEITQTYLLSDPLEPVRVNHRVSDGHHTYYETTLQRLEGAAPIEIEHNLTKKEYSRRLKDADPARRTVVRQRYRLIWEGQIFEIDLFPFWPDRALCGIEPFGDGATLKLPPALELIREVTGDPAFETGALAAPEEPSPKKSE